MNTYPPEDEGLVASSHSHSGLVVLDLVLLQHNITLIYYKKVLGEIIKIGTHLVQ